MSNLLGHVHMYRYFWKRCQKYAKAADRDITKLYSTDDQSEALEGGTSLPETVGRDGLCWI